MSKPTILQEAQAAVYGERGDTYGHPSLNFERTAELWQAHMCNRKPGLMRVDDVAIMLALMKIARLEETPEHRDGWADLAGYAECGARVMGIDE